MKILVTGVKGQLGYDVMKVLGQRKIECLGADIEEFEYYRCSGNNCLYRALAPDAVIHCSA